MTMRSSQSRNRLKSASPSNSSRRNFSSSKSPTPSAKLKAASNTIDMQQKQYEQERECFKPSHKQYQCYCIKEFYEDDELCRRNRKGRLEFGIVSRYENEGKDNLKVFWTLDNEIEEQGLDLDNPQFYEHLRLVDRKAEPGDIIFINQKRGEVVDVSWSCYARILENGMCLLDIPCDRLEPLLPHYPGQRLELDGWIGTVTSISTEATLMFSRGGTVTGTVNCGSLPQDQQPYPGRRVTYTYDEYMEADLRLLDDNSIDDLLDEDESLEAFVLFLHVSEMEVKWNGKVALTTDSTEMPSATVTRGQFKKKGKILGASIDIDWDSSSDAVDRLYQCSAQAEDLIIPESREDMVEEYMTKKYFDYEAEVENPSKTFVHMLGEEYNVMMNVPYAVRVLRFGRILHVKWASSGKVDKIPSNRVTLKHSFKRPFHQFIQKKVPLSPFSDDEYGIISSYDTNDTVLVQWLIKHKSNIPSEDPDPAEFRVKLQSVESVYDLEPHFSYGSISPKKIVYRSVNCRLPEAVFTVGWVRSVNQLGQVIVVGMHTKQEYQVYPSEIATTGMKIHDDEIPPPFKRVGKSIMDLHGLPTLKRADEQFVRNLQRQLDQAGSRVPDTGHFELLPKAPHAHAFFKNKFVKKSISRWMRAVKKDQIYLRTRANDDFSQIWVKAYSDRFDLYSVLIAAPAGTPYEGGLFEFDVQLGIDYPSTPPDIYMVTVLTSEGCTGIDRRAILQPGIHSLELLRFGSVMPPHTLAESLIAIQSKLFTSSGSLDSLSPPSSAGSFQRREFLTKESEERLTNAQILIDVLDLVFRMVMDPPKHWNPEVINHFFLTFEKTRDRMLSLIRLPNSTTLTGAQAQPDWLRPTFPIMVPTEGFINAVLGRIKRFEELMGLLQG